MIEPRSRGVLDAPPSRGMTGANADSVSQNSKLAVQTSRENMDRATVGVVGGVGDELIIRRHRDRLGERVGIIVFQNALAPVVERAVADQGTETARRDEVAMIARQRID